jgi:hypothetical protein
MGYKRMCMLAASVAWLAAGAVFGVESFGIPSFVAWRPALFLLFLAINAFAVGVVVAEVLVAARPQWLSRRVWFVKWVAGALLFVSVMVYLEFVQTHAVTARIY